MRPLPGESSPPGPGRLSRRSSTTHDDLTTPLARPHTQTPQMSYFLADERTMEASLSLTRSPSEERLLTARHNFKKNLGIPLSKTTEEELESLTDSPILQSRPFTPLSFGSPAPRSLGGSPRRGSDVGSYTLDDAESQAIASSSEDEGGDGKQDMLDSGSAPQLVMPSIKMPSRRPFTEKGKNMGRLKIMIAGDTAVGKTSLIKAIVQTCEDIVHVDPLTAAPTSPGQRRRSRTKSGSGRADSTSTMQITEVFASTRAYPAWWSDLDDSRFLRRRKSMGDSVLERNLCFVDTPGYGRKSSCLECITPVVEYVESQFRRASRLEEASEPEIINLLSGGGGSQVDVVLYLIINSIKPIDLDFMQRLTQLTNVVPILSFADTFSQEEITAKKDEIASELQKADINCFTGLGSTPFAISTGPSKDLEAMDASLLMSPDYVQPLCESELTDLVQKLFDPDTISWLRHSSSKKFVQWRSSSTPVSRPQSLYRPLTSSSNGSLGITAPVGATTSCALARISDHTQREERIAQVRLANWAIDLQRSLYNERQRYDALARSERAVWLTERLGECVQDGSIVPIAEARKQEQMSDPESRPLVKKCGYLNSRNRALGVDRHDPLGLLQLNEDLQQKMWMAVKVVSGFGLLGGFAYWLAKNIRGEEVTVWGFGGLTMRDMVDFELLSWR